MQNDRARYKAGSKGGIWEHLRCRDSISQIRAHHNGGMLCPCGYSYSVNKAVGCKKQSSYQLTPYHITHVRYGSVRGSAIAHPSTRSIIPSCIYGVGYQPSFRHSAVCLSGTQRCLCCCLSRDRAVPVGVVGLRRRTPLCAEPHRQRVNVWPLLPPSHAPMLPAVRAPTARPRNRVRCRIATPLPGAAARTERARAERRSRLSSAPETWLPRAGPNRRT